MRSATINFALTTMSLGNASGATVTATGWVQTTNEYIPFVMAVVAILVVIIQGITVWIQWINRKR